MTPAIEIKDVWKRYYLGTYGYGSLRKDMRSIVSKFSGKSSPAAADINDDKEFFALQGISFNIEKGERIGIIGENGAGKSTLLKILSRVTLPTQGEIRIRGRCASLLEVGTGFNPELSGRENIYLNGAILGMSKQDIRRRFDEIVDFSGVEKFIDTPVKRYSSGMYVRLAFAVAAHLDPEILILDEVLAVGDALFQKKCLGKMENVAKNEGRTVVFVSHSMPAVAALCTRTVLLKKGKVDFIGDTKTAIARYMDSVYVGGESSIRYDEDSTKQAQFTEVILRNHLGEPSTTIDITQPFSVEMGYRVKETLSGAILGASIMLENNECLISSCDYDLDKEKLGPRLPGEYRASVNFPANLFNTGACWLVVGISIPGKYVFDRREVLKFEFYDGGSFMAQGGGELRRNSLLLMPLAWQEMNSAP